MPDSVRRLAPLRHTCTLCGGCCQGAIVHLVSDTEVARVRLQAIELGLADPVDDSGRLPRLRQEGGRCVMLDPDNLCLLHARFGADDKPMVCRQFPYVRVRTEAGPREGIDPAAGGLIGESSMTPLAPPQEALVRPVEWPPGRARAEAQLVEWLGRADARFTHLLHLLGGGRPTDDLPEGLAERWVQTLDRSAAGALLQRAEVGPVHRAAVQPLFDALPRWVETGPPAWAPLSASREALVLRSIRGMLFLRLASRIPMSAAVALLVACGAMAAHWALPDDDEAFGAALANWCRLLRADPFWGTLMPSAEHLAWLASGR